MLNLHPRSHVTQDYQDLHWLTVDQQNHFKILTITFKCIHCLAPSPLAVKVRLSLPLDMLLDSSQFYPTSSLGKKAFSYSAPCCWNALPRSLCVIPCLETFKAHLKHHLFTNFSSYKHAVDPYTWLFLLLFHSCLTHSLSLLSFTWSLLYLTFIFFSSPMPCLAHVALR